MKVELRAHASPVRCVLCHADDGDLEECAGCGARIHLECRSEIRNCPTLGCTAGDPERVRTQLEVARGRIEGQGWIRESARFADAEEERLSTDHTRQLVAELNEHERLEEVAFVRDLAIKLLAFVAAASVILSFWVAMWQDRHP